MIANKLEPKQALNKSYKSYLKLKPDAENIRDFKAELARLLELCDEKKDEEFNKNLLSDFLKKSFYDDRYFINTKDMSDLVIHNDKGADSKVGVIFETKKPTKISSAEMPRVDALNHKAFQQLVLYFLRERVTHRNFAVKHLIVTNIYEWFIFDAKLFEELFVRNHDLVKEFEEFEAKRLSGTKTDFFYKQIAEPAIASVIDQIKFTHFDLRDLENLDLIDLYKIFSPEHLLKLPFANDSNSLNKPFYNELLYIIGLTEEKDKGKKLIRRMKEGDRQDGSLIENAISRLESLGKLSRLSKPEEFGDNDEERLFNVALRLSINWINRILFLKLLEAQLIKYHQGDREYAFLNLEKVQNYDDLDSLFFDVLAKEQDKREAKVKAVFANVPYLNSSLFEPTETEQETIVIGNLKDRDLPIFGATVLTDSKGNKRSGKLNALAYLFEFLGAYRFDRDEFEDSQDDSEKLINAAVLGLIFEKINGYKDGSFYTPSFITMYMCRETIRRAVVQKFNEVKGWNCETIKDLYGRIEDKKEANTIINSLKICDPAVGSGHFLVSALNEIIAIKSELRVLLDKKGWSLRDYYVRVVNDKLVVRDDEENLFVYKPKNYERTRVQEALFHEKQTIIESCLFGVDINPNSVTICRLRLWIELLKHAYYRPDGNLETLPNIDINIKCGNSLISRFGLDVDVKQVLQKQKFSIEQYRDAVQTYRSAESKAQKREMEGLIAKIKAGFSSSLLAGDPKKVKLRQLQAELYGVENQMLLLEESKAEIKAREKRVNKLNNEIDKLSAEIEDIESGRLYENALEWRFEFPEVLNKDGDFVGFDIVIGNPPYIRQEEIKEQKPHLQANFTTYSGTADLYVFFVEKGFEILKNKGQFSYIMPNKWMQAGYGKELRKYFLGTQLQAIIDFGDLQVFEEATTYPCILNASKQMSNTNFISAAVKTLNYSNGFGAYIESISNAITSESLNKETWMISSSDDQELLLRIKKICIPLVEYTEIKNPLEFLFDNPIGNEAHYGVKTGLTEAFLVNDEQKDRMLEKDSKSSELLKPLLRGRTIKKWYAEQDNLWLIGTFPALDIDIDDYPAIRDHLLSFGKERLEQSGKKGSRKKTSGKWFETQDNIAYWQEFEKPKIMYQVFQVNPCFIYDDQGLYCNNSMWFISKDDKVLLAILNSTMGWWLISKYCTAIQNGYQLIWKYFGQIPIPKATQKQAKLITSIVDEILTAKRGDRHADTTKEEKAIDDLVYQLYGLTEEEIKIVEGER
ncbi:class I SAM-dependent DNA methyltransferase [Pseudanabaena sp. FACHB-1277]|uniref:site-specific DNA-methyltransferase (adenine-specific) n=1 Tax=Pseudanabaena cinerea FACHB-1277 TaxID=2949581 RepID=A0A926URI4_9CYAN|nr:Eco57I restriction-modification methylase domain-containing protein [Pseudanabaena cinerea]MBD2149543.1 class I SAM-dependent DNA methyltransferase [Pseudanabaena cinerea FACHB-1277]